MSIQDTIDSIETNISNSYDKVALKNGTIPQDKNLDNLPDAINSIPTGVDVSDTTATASDVLSGEDFYLADGTKTTGTIQTYSGSSSVTPTTSQQTLSTSGNYLNTNITIGAVNPDTYTDPYDVQLIAINQGGGVEPSVVNKLPSLVDRSITSVSASDLGNITKIGAGAFMNCYSLTSIELPSTLTEIGMSAFYNCSYITGDVIIPDGVTIINTQAFNNCSRVNSFTIGTGVASILALAFAGCSRLQSITVKRATPPSITNNTFNSTNNCPIYVPAGSVETYKTTTFWSDLASRIQAIPE